RLVRATALDCIPEVRRQALTLLAAQAGPLETPAIADALAYPTTTARRTLEDLTGHQLVQRFAGTNGNAHSWQISSLARELLWRAQTPPPRGGGKGQGGLGGSGGGKGRYCVPPRGPRPPPAFFWAAPAHS